jgi:3-hydroxyacyl-CoA dehydrogenase
MTRFGMTLGPLELLDEIGLDTALQSGMVVSEVSGERTPGTELLLSLVKAGKTGVKSGCGIYSYPKKNSAPYMAADGRTVPASPESASPCDSDTIVTALLQPMAAEAARLLAEKKAEFAWQIDLVTIFGLGFPLWRGGLHCWIASSG